MRVWRYLEEDLGMRMEVLMIGSSKEKLLHLLFDLNPTKASSIPKFVLPPLFRSYVALLPLDLSSIGCFLIYLMFSWWMLGKVLILVKFICLRNPRLEEMIIELSLEFFMLPKMFIFELLLFNSVKCPFKLCCFRFDFGCLTCS